MTPCAAAVIASVFLFKETVKWTLSFSLSVFQVNFVVCQLFALLTACWFRLYLHPSKTSPFIRHVVATLLGFYLALFCFGWWVYGWFLVCVWSPWILLIFIHHITPLNMDLEGLAKAVYQYYSRLDQVQLQVKWRAACVSNSRHKISGPIIHMQ